MSSTSPTTRRLFGTDGVRGIANTELSPQLAATGAVLSSITSALTNIPVLARQTRRNDLAARLTWITLGLAALGILAVLAEFKLHIRF